MNNENKFNEEWWDKNPMTYEDWNLSENIRSSTYILHCATYLCKYQLNYLFKKTLILDTLESTIRTL